MFIDSLKLFIPFSSSVYEKFSETFLTIEGNSDIDFIDEGGYIMKDNQYLFKEDMNLSISDSFTFGFYLYPYCYGVVENPSDSSFENIKMPLFDFVDGSNSILRFEEHAKDNCFNYLKLYLGDEFSVETPEYSSSLWHYFWICYNGSEIEIYIDGVQASCDFEGGLPPSIDGSILSLYINHSISGYDYNISKNLGAISQLFLMNEFNNNKYDMQKSVNRNILYVIDDDYTNINLDSCASYVNDPNMITITSSIDDVSYVYLGRNDGKILRGSPLFWEVRKRFSNVDEKQFLILNGEDSISNGFLKIKESVIRL